MNFSIFRYSIRKILAYFECKLNLYLRVHSRPKFFDEHTKHLYQSYPDVGPAFGILLQGPIIAEDNFTLQTVKQYKYIYPNVIIIVSTAVDSDQFLIKDIEDAGVNVITYQIPEFKGISNVNMQILSTMAGLRFLKEKGVKYMLKGRTDQRCSKQVDFLSFMRNLQTVFPVHDAVIKERLIIISTNAFSTRFYPITDMFMFGRIVDMELYWNMPLDTAVEYDKDPDWVTFMKYNVAEGYLVNNFFKKINFIPNWTSEDSEYFLSKYFCIIDQEQVDLYWLKYERFFDIHYSFTESIYKHRVRKEFAMWLSAWSKYNSN